MKRLKFGIWNMKSGRFTIGAVSFVFAAVTLAVFATEALARVGGGQGYGGGGGGGDGDGEGLGIIIYLIFRLLLWLTIEYPAIGIPLDIIVIGAVIYWFTRRSKKPASVVSSSPVLGLSTGPGGQPQPDIQRAFNQLRRFDPNFSEIIFTDFCYALYGRAHDARGKGQAALDDLSPYLSDAARGSLLQLNPDKSGQVKAVQGIIVGAMQVADVRGLTTPAVEVSVEF
ncbi:MAG: hypothetical protein ACXWID_18590, partial [Pyrinomonadaceae bacterium]